MIRKRFAKYSVMYGLPNINPHALRRGFAKRLLNKGAHIAFISKALGHSDIAVTTRYLHIDKEEVANNLRKYLGIDSCRYGQSERITWTRVC